MSSRCHIANSIRLLLGPIYMPCHFLYFFYWILNSCRAKWQRRECANWRPKWECVSCAEWYECLNVSPANWEIMQIWPAIKWLKCGPKTLLFKSQSEYFNLFFSSLTLLFDVVKFSNWHATFWEFCIAGYGWAQLAYGGRGGRDASAPGAASN